MEVFVAMKTRRGNVRVGSGDVFGDVRLHPHDDEGELSYHYKSTPLKGTMGEGEARAYWEKLGDEGKRKYGSWKSLVDQSKVRRGLGGSGVELDEADDVDGAGYLWHAVPKSHALEPKEADEYWEKLHPDARSKYGYKWHLMKKEYLGHGVSEDHGGSESERKAFDSRLTVHPVENSMLNRSGGVVHGASNIVHDVHDSATGKRYAVKEYVPSFGGSSDRVTVDNQACAEVMGNRILREVFGLKAPRSHIHESIDMPWNKGMDADDSRKCVVSEWIDGEKLFEQDMRSMELERHPALNGELSPEVRGDLSRLFVASMLSGDYDVIGPVGKNTLVVSEGGANRLAPIDNSGYGFSPVGGLLDEDLNPVGVDSDVPYWSGKSLDGSKIPYVPLVKSRETARNFGYPHNYFSPVMSVLSDEDVSKGLDVLEGFTDRMVDQYVNEAGFRKSNVNGFGSPEEISRVIKSRRDYLIEANRKYKSKGVMWDVNPERWWRDASYGMSLFRAVVSRIDPSIGRQILALRRHGVPVSRMKDELGRSQMDAFGASHLALLKMKAGLLDDVHVRMLLRFHGME